jgi:hypothetical protein
MTALVAELPDLTIGEQNQMVDRESASQLTPAEGRAARALRELNLQHDRVRGFGGLRRVQSPPEASSGSVLIITTNTTLGYQ